MNGSDWVVVDDLYLMRETPNAYGLGENPPDGYDTTIDVWIPKSQTEGIQTNDDGTVSLTMRRWIAEKNDLNYHEG